MRPAQLPANEAERLAVLRAYGILDTPEEESYDELARIAGAICGAPISLITFIEEERQWFKAAIGTDLREGLRTASFCQHAILQSDVFEVPDALEDPDFADAGVEANIAIRFYAGHPLLAPGGEAIGTLCIADTTPHKLTAEQAELLRVLAHQVMHQLELRRALRGLAQAHQAAMDLGVMKDKFMRMASHDLKNPLMVMMNAASLLKRDVDTGAVAGGQAAALIPMLQSSTAHMHRILEDFLDFRAVADGKFTLRPAPVNLNTLAAEVLESQRGYAAEKEIELSLEPDGAMPQISADPDRVRQVMANLIGNAIKFSPHGSGVLVITRAGGAGVTFEVLDEGPGLRDEDMPKLFTLYAKLAAQATGGESGSGIGLYICKQLVEAHGGAIGARNAGAAGAVFWFSLPTAAAGPQ